MQQFTDINILSLLILFAASQGVFIALYLVFERKSNLKANRYLAMILFGLCFQLYDYFMLSNSLFEQFPHAFLFSYPFTLAYAPLLFLFIKTVTRTRSPNWVATLHFVPAFVHFIYGLFTYHFHDASFKLKYLANYIGALQNTTTYKYYSLFSLVISLQLFVYISLSVIELIRYKTRSKDVNSYRTPKSLKWLMHVMAGVILLFVFSSMNFAFYISKITPDFNFGYLALILVSVYIYYLSFFIINNPEIFKPQISLKYESSRLLEGDKRQIIAALKEYLAKEKPHRNANLTISALAKLVGVQAKNLSQVINERYEQNFYEFINSHRIDEAKMLLADTKYDSFSIFGIGLEVGFNSKSSFNSAFKKFTNTTPLDYKKSTRN